MKNKTRYKCNKCGAKYLKWIGRCEACESWNSLTEIFANEIENNYNPKFLAITQKSTLLNIRTKTGFSDLDLVLGGGIIESSVILLAGEPGMGKSTLLLQIANHISKNSKVLYVSGEESMDQVHQRLLRVNSNHPKQIDFIDTTDAEEIAHIINNYKYSLVVIDSIQMMKVKDVSSTPGSVNQITSSSNIVNQAIKKNKTSAIIVGHVTKEGSIAGPKVLEHLVDVVLQFEGEKYGGFKIIRSSKNRFGGTNESAIFEMKANGLSQVINPSKHLLEERKLSDGSIVLATMDGNRPLLVEIQALVNTTKFGYPKRTSSGFDLNRLNILLAVLEKRTKLILSDKDVFINVVGGVKLNDPAADLAIAMAIASALLSKKITNDFIVFGELGLGGEVRSVRNFQKRISEAKKLGFKGIIAPKIKETKDNYLHQVENINNAIINYLI